MKTAGLVGSSVYMSDVSAKELERRFAEDTRKANSTRKMSR
jgi:hypothetical protein